MLKLFSIFVRDAPVAVKTGSGHWPLWSVTYAVVHADYFHVMYEVQTFSRKTYLYSKVLSNGLPVVSPHDDITIDMNKVFVATLLGGTGPDTHIGDGGRVRLIVYGVVEYFITGESGVNTHLATDEEVQS